MKNLTVSTFGLLLSFSLLVGCKRDAEPENGPVAEAKTQLFQKQGERLAYTNSDSVSQIKVSDLAPTDVLVAINGRAITVSDWRDRLDFESAVFSYQYRNRPESQREAERAKFLTMRGPAILGQLAAQYWVGDYLADIGASFDSKQLEDERNRLVKAFKFKGTYSDLVKTFKSNSDYADAQLLYPRYVRLARECFDPTCAEVSESEIEVGLAKMEEYYQFATASNTVTYAMCSNLVKRLQKETIDFAVVARQIGVQDLDEAAQWDRFEPAEIEDSQLRAWVFSAPVGSVGGPFLLDDGLSVVKILDREAGTMEPSLASGGVAAVELARMTFDYVEPEPEPRTREHVREALLEWKGTRAQKKMFESFQEEHPLVFPHGSNLDFDMATILKGDNDEK